MPVNGTGDQAISTNRFHPLTISSIRRQTPDAVAITFAIPKELEEVFAFLPGQYLTLQANIGGNRISRSYSICSRPDEPGREVGVKHIPNGIFSDYAFKLKVGDSVLVMPPQGRFTARIGGRHDYLLLAAGSGITPCLAIVKSVLACEPESRIVLVYANRSHASIMFLDDLNALKDRYTDRFTLLHVLDEEEQDISILNGRVDGEKLTAFAAHGLIEPAGYDAVYICGPEPMTLSALSALERLGVARERIHYEFFMPMAEAPPVLLGASPAISRPEQSRVEIIYDGIRRTILVDPATDTILSAATKAGLDLPCSCRSGICCICRSRIITGTATMAENHSLEPWEIAAGFTLACQARPASPRLVLDFDAL